MGRRLVFVYVFVLALVLGTVTAAVAAPKTGCPAGDDWTESTVAEAAATVWPALLDQSPWANEAAFADFLDATYDRNDDGAMCIKTMWGEDLNPNSHWYKVGLEVLGSPTQLFVIRDNNSNGSNG